MLNSFAVRKAAEVAAAVGGMRTTLAAGRSDVDAKFGALTQATTSATSALQVAPVLLPEYVSQTPYLVWHILGLRCSGAFTGVAFPS